MRITIGDFRALDRTVPVTFADDDGFEHSRPVNAVLTETGDYDPKATAERVDQVALGVERKRQVGAFAVPPAPEPAADSVAEEAPATETAPPAAPAPRSKK